MTPGTRGRFFSVAGTLVLVTSTALGATSCSSAPAQVARAAATDFATSFEVNDSPPTWVDTVATDAQGHPLAAGVSGSATGSTPMASDVGTGPATVWNAKALVGWTGRHALRYAGYVTGSGHVYEYNKLYAVNIPVTSVTTLSYLVFPEYTNADVTRPSTFVSVDLQFSDGSALRSLNAQDQHGYTLNGSAQGSSKSLYVNQWNAVSSSIGAVAAGKTITTILVDYDSPQGTAGVAFQGWIDDLRLVEPGSVTVSHLSDWVNTTRGSMAGKTFSRGNASPDAALPHGFNQLTPMTDANSLSWYYNYASSNDANNLPTLQALAITHQPSPWIGDRNTFEIMPADNGGSVQPQVSFTGRALEFSHAEEVARPYYYGVTFTNGIKAEMTPTDHAGMMRMTFGGIRSSLVFDQPADSGGTAVETNGGPLGMPDGVVTGYSDVASKTSAGVTRMFFYGKVLLGPDQTIVGGGEPTSSLGAGGTHVTRYITVDTSLDKTVTVEFATSLISLAQAKANVALEIGASDTFDALQARAQAAWDQALGAVTVQGASADQLTTLYSSLYRLNLYPNEGYENAGTSDHPQYRYASPVSPVTGSATATETNAKIVNGTIYNNNGFWDTYRAAWPLDSLLYPQLTGRMIQGFVQQFLDGGWIARWSAPGYTNDVNGTGADDAFTDAYLNGVRNFNFRSFYNAAVKDATVASPSPATGRNGLVTSIFTGYTSTAIRYGLSWAMSGYDSDYGIAMMSHSLCTNPALAADPQHSEFCANDVYFRNLAQQYVTLWDSAAYDPALGAASTPAGFFVGRTPAGDFRATPATYDPQVWEGDYTEADGWTMLFAPTADPQGLAALMGGQAALGKRLDQYFSIPETASKSGKPGNPGHTALEASQVQLGQFEMNNEPGFAIPYLYDAAGTPSKAQAIVREVLARMFVGSEVGAGYPGDEDNGAMSSWYILSALGFYPLSVGGTDMVVGSPLFREATLHLANGRSLVINAANNGAHNVYVQGLTINGHRWDKAYVPRSLLSSGGEIDFAMGAKPSTWGTAADAAPSTLTAVAGAVPQPFHDLATAGTATGIAGAPALFDDTSATQVSFTSPQAGAANPQVQYQLASPQTAAMYTLTSGDISGGGDPTGWVLSGSPDGKTWTTLDQQSGQAFAWRQQTRAFVIHQPAAYLYYRLEITASTSAPTATLAEVELLGSG